MRLLPVRAAVALPFLFGFALFLTATARADLVWTKQGGWSVEGGALSGVVGNEARNALEAMNRARNSEEDGSTSSAARGYVALAKRYPNSIYAPEALYRAARLYLIRKQYNKAFDNFQAVLSRYPNTKRFNEITG
ncbi:MAG: hypothetical protein RIQ93_3346, partial [Verrucomicrobiota bacterium]